MKNVVALMLGASMLLAACGGSTPAATEGTTDGGTTAISVWHGYIETEEQAFSQAVADFTAANSDVTIDVLAIPFEELTNKFQTEVAAGGGPTLVTGPQDRMASYAEAGLLAPIDESATFLENLVPVAVDGGRVNDELVGVPINSKVVSLFYNKSMVDTPPADFDELLSLAAEYGMAVTANWFHNYMWGPAFGAQFFDENFKVVIDSPAGVEAYSYLKQLCESEGITCDSNDGNMDTLFRQGDVAFRIQGPWMAGDAISDLGAENIGVVAIPPISGDDRPRPWNQAEMISLNVDASPEETAAALRFIEYLTSTDVQATFLEQANWIPVNANVDTAINPVVGGFLEQVPYSDPFPVARELAATWEPMEDAITKILEDVEPPEEALAESAELINTANNK